MAGSAGGPPWDRVVEVEADLGPGAGNRYRYGSGFRVGGRLVLTAAHVVAEAHAGGVTVRGPDKVRRPARVIQGLTGDPGTVDLALLELGGEVAGLPFLPVAAVDRDLPVPVPVEGCWAVGYPLFQETGAATALRETAQVWGMILPGENLVSGLLSFQVTSSPPALPLGGSQWSGMSGAAVLAGEQLIGVVSEHAPRRGESVLTVTPLASVSKLPAAAAGRWWDLLGTGPKRLARLPENREREEPAYRATVRQLRSRTGVLLGREEELAEIGAFATGQPGVLAAPGGQYAWLTGGPWTGKTALLAEAVHALPPEVDCMAYFLTRRTGDADRERFLAAVVPQLAWLLDQETPPVLDEHVFRHLWERAARRAAGEGRHLLLVVDGLDEDLRPGGHSVAAWLPGPLPGLPARVLTASRLYPQLPEDTDPAHPLALLARTGGYVLTSSPHAARQRDLADAEVTQLLRGTGDDLALDVLGLLTAAHGGPLALADLAALTQASAWKVRAALDGLAGRALQQVGPADAPRYAFAHDTLLDRCRQQGAAGPGHESGIRQWAARWRDRGWPAARGGQQGTPLYLLDSYPQALHGDPPQLMALVGDPAWVITAIQGLGVDAVLAVLAAAVDAAPSEPPLAAVHAVVRQQAHNLRGREAAADPGFVSRQLCLQAAQLGETLLEAGFRNRQLACDDSGPVLQHTTQQAGHALILEVGRHPGGVGAMAALPDGRLATRGSRRDREVLMWDPAQPGVSPVLLGHHREVGVMAVLPDGRLATGGSGEGQVLVWDPAQPGVSPVLLGQDLGGVGVMAVLPDGCLATGSGRRDGKVLVWDPALPPGVSPVFLGHHREVGVMAVLPDGRLVTGGDFGGVLVWDLEQMGADPVHLGHLGEVRAMAALPDGRLATNGIFQDEGVLVWDLTQPGADPVFLGHHPGGVGVMAVLPDGRLATGGSWEGEVLVWDPEQPGADPVHLGHPGGVTAMAVLPDGRLATGGGFGDVLVWDPDMTQRRPVRPVSRKAGAEVMAVLSDGRLATGGSGEGEVLVWDLAQPGTSPVLLGQHRGGVDVMAVLSDERLVTRGFLERDVVVWDLARPGVGHVHLGQDPDGEWMMEVLPDGRLATGGGFREALWDVEQPGIGPVLLGQNLGEVGVLAVLPDGRLVTGGDFGEVVVWDLSPVLLGHHPSVKVMAVLPDGRLATGGSGEGEVLVWDPAQPGASPVRLGQHPGEVGVMAVLPDGRLVTGGSWEGKVLVWDPVQPGASPVLLGHHREVGVMAVLPDGRLVTCGSGEGDVLAWDPVRPGASPVLLGHHLGVRVMAVLPDGRLVTGGTDRKILLWHTLGGPPETLLACPVDALATSPAPKGTRLIIGQATGFSCWQIGPTEQAPA